MCFKFFSIPFSSPIFFCLLFHLLYYFVVGRDNDILRNGRSRDRIRVGARFSVPFQTPWDPTSLPHNGCRVCTESKTVGVWCRPSTPSSTKVKERVELYFYSLSEPSCPVPV
jgi:hypothetical protein